MISLLLLSLFLSISTAAHVIYSPPTWPPETAVTGYYSDVLNVTKCYCQGLNEESNLGSHYYQFDYHNYYHRQDYTLAWTCDSDVLGTGKAKVGGKRVHFPLPDCWNAKDSWRDKKRMECGRASNADTFCYETGDSHDPWDYYYFNGQRKRLPDDGIMEFPPYQCADLCRDKVGGKVVASECTFLFPPPQSIPLLPSAEHVSGAVSPFLPCNPAEKAILTPMSR